MKEEDRREDIVEVEERGRKMVGGDEVCRAGKGGVLYSQCQHSKEGLVLYV